LDGIDRREIASVPGHSAVFSPNGRWLATIDGDGIVRVWELPLRRPWQRIFGYAAIATLACALAFLLVRWPFRRAAA
jgi:WD40 repeat protein